MATEKRTITDMYELRGRQLVTLWDGANKKTVRLGMGQSLQSRFDVTDDVSVETLHGQVISVEGMNAEVVAE